MLAWMRESASSFSGDVDSLVLIIALTVGFWFFLAEYALFYFIFKFRRKEGRAAAYITGERAVEKRWITIPHILIIICDIGILAFSFQVWSGIKQDLPPADETIRVVGHQWSWRFVHPGADRQLGTADDIETIDELHLEEGTLYHFQLEAADVLHSFSIPAFRLKQDAVPGRVITGWFQPTQTGTFDIQCAEICGIGHGMMGARLVVQSTADHQRWLEAHLANQRVLHAGPVTASTERRE
jgi:cytochrome c oxidase subunit II